MTYTTPAAVTVGELYTASKYNTQVKDNIIHLKDLIDNLVPVGTIWPYAGSTPPSGWLACNGQAVSRTTYSDLHTLMSGDSYPFGNGDGSTTFNLPDLRGRTVLGSGTGASLTARSLGDVVGAETHTLTEAQMPVHNHNIPRVGSGGGSGTRVASDDQATGPAFDIVSDNAGSGSAHNNMQPSAVLTYMIKATAGA